MEIRSVLYTKIAGVLHDNLIKHWIHEVMTLLFPFDLSIYKVQSFPNRNNAKTTCVLHETSMTEGIQNEVDISHSHVIFHNSTSDFTRQVAVCVISCRH